MPLSGAVVRFFNHDASSDLLPGRASDSDVGSSIEPLPRRTTSSLMKRAARQEALFHLTGGGKADSNRIYQKRSANRGTLINLRRRRLRWWGRKDLNLRLLPSQGSTLSAELHPQVLFVKKLKYTNKKPTVEEISTVGLRNRSLLQLTFAAGNAKPHFLSRTTAANFRGAPAYSRRAWRKRHDWRRRRRNNLSGLSVRK